MLRAILVFIGFLCLLGSCTQKVVCPAYQSAFIYDQDELRKKFSYFNEDSTPKLATVNKTKYLIAEPTSFKKKTRSLQTVEAKPINPVVPDSLLMDDDAVASELDAAARSVIDSTYIVDVEPAGTDSVGVEEDYVISVDREVRVLKYKFPDSVKYDEATGLYVRESPRYYIEEVGFNVDQGSYMWYLRDVLVLPDVRLEKQAAEKKEEEEKKKKGFKGFFSNLFKKKNKETVVADTVQQKSADLNEYNYDDFDDSPADSASQSSAPPVKKKGILSIFKKKDKPAKQKAQPKPKKADEPPAKKDEDDGF
ncbi:MAG: hypothetical protein OEU76_01280 [Cyclobacteriaceae bacterium]|nr:hypothetical protein [Cyclobacteriaceae bacterium]